MTVAPPIGESSGEFYVQTADRRDFDNLHGAAVRGAQQPDAAKLKADVVSIIKGDKAKMQTYCQINDLRDQIGEADEQKDRKKAKDVDPNSNEGQEIESLFEKVDESCPH
jgi:hypothetical protein